MTSQDKVGRSPKLQRSMSDGTDIHLHLGSIDGEYDYARMTGPQMQV